MYGLHGGRHVGRGKFSLGRWEHAQRGKPKCSLASTPVAPAAPAAPEAELAAGTAADDVLMATPSVVSPCSQPEAAADDAESAGVVARAAPLAMRTQRAVHYAQCVPLAELGRVADWATNMSAAIAQCADWQPGSSDAAGMAAHELVTSCGAFAEAWTRVAASLDFAATCTQLAAAASRSLPADVALVTTLQQYMSQHGWRLGCTMHRVFMYVPMAASGGVSNGAADGAVVRAPTALPKLLSDVADIVSPYLASLLRGDAMGTLLARAIHGLVRSPATQWLRIDPSLVQFTNCFCVDGKPQGALAAAQAVTRLASGALAAVSPRAVLAVPLAGVGTTASHDMGMALAAVRHVFNGTSARTCPDVLLAWCGAAFSPTAGKQVAWPRLLVLTREAGVVDPHPLAHVLDTFVHHAIAAWGDCAPQQQASNAAPGGMVSPPLVVRVSSEELDAHAATPDGRSVVIQRVQSLLTAGIAVCVDVAPGCDVPLVIMDTEPLRLAVAHVHVHADTAVPLAALSTAVHTAAPYLLQAAAWAVDAQPREDRTCVTLLRSEVAAAALRPRHTESVATTPTMLLAEMLQAQTVLRLRHGAAVAFEDVHAALRAYASVRNCSACVSDLLPQHIVAASEVVVASCRTLLGDQVAACSFAAAPLAVHEPEGHTGGRFRNLEVVVK